MRLMLIDTPNRYPKEWFYKHRSQIRWFLANHRRDKRIHGTGTVSCKGISLFHLEQPLLDGYLDPDRYEVPGFRIATPGLVGLIDRLPAKEKLGEAIELNDELRAMIESTVVPGLSQQVMDRSMALCEGGPNRSAAGIYNSYLVGNTLGEHLEAVQKISECAYHPIALAILGRFRKRNILPGVIFQDAVTGETQHAIFNTAFEGEIRGQIRDETKQTIELRQRFGEPEEKEGIDNELVVSIHELAMLFSDSGRIAVELETIRTQGEPKTKMLQHRFVGRLGTVHKPGGLVELAKSEDVVGSKVASCNWLIVCERANNHAAQLALFLLDKELHMHNQRYILLAPSQLFSETPVENRALYMKAQAVIEYDNGVAHGQAEGIPAHFKRLTADLDDLFIACDFDYSPFVRAALEQKHADLELLNETDLLFLPDRLRAYAKTHMKTAPPMLRTDVMAIRLEQPLVVYGNESIMEGGIYSST